MAIGEKWSKAKPATLSPKLFIYLVSHPNLGETTLGPYKTRQNVGRYKLIAEYEYHLDKDNNYILIKST